MKKVPFVDLSAQNKLIIDEVTRAFKGIVADSAFIKGRYVEEFERNFAVFCRARHCVGVGNGTDAIFIALKSFGIGTGDEVIVPANTFIATAEAVSLAGAKVVFVDCDDNTYNMDVGLFEAAITSRTKAVIAVHLYGQPVDLIGLSKIAEKYDLKIIQDCAQAHGLTCSGRPLADYGDVLCYSFFPGKNLGAFGDAGAVVGNSDEDCKKARMFANHGRIDKYSHEFEGVNSRLDGIQAAVLKIKLKYLSEWNRQRREAAAIYCNLLADYEQVKLPYVLYENEHVYHLFVIRCKRRDQLKDFLADKGVATGIHYPIPLPNLKAYEYLGYKPGDFPVAGRCQSEILSLPIYPGISEEQINYVVDQMRAFYL